MERTKQGLVKQSGMSIGGGGGNAAVTPAWLSLRGICQLLSLSKSSLWRARKNDPTFPTGRRIAGIDNERFSREEILAWVSRQPLSSEMSGARGFRGGSRLAVAATPSAE
jgi:predicted DNA-binding transcriptional regulator AlpA